MKDSVSQFFTIIFGRFRGSKSRIFLENHQSFDGTQKRRDQAFKISSWDDSQVPSRSHIRQLTEHGMSQNKNLL